MQKIRNFNRGAREFISRQQNLTSSARELARDNVGNGNYGDGGFGGGDRGGRGGRGDDVFGSEKELANGDHQQSQQSEGSSANNAANNTNDNAPRNNAPNAPEDLSGNPGQTAQAVQQMAQTVNGSPRSLQQLFAPVQQPNGSLGGSPNLQVSQGVMRAIWLDDNLLLARSVDVNDRKPVSYTHLTLPTIYSV